MPRPRCGVCIVEAIKTPTGERTSVQQLAVDWMTGLVRQLRVSSAEQAGAQYAVVGRAGPAAATGSWSTTPTGRGPGRRAHPGAGAVPQPGPLAVRRPGHREGEDRVLPLPAALAVPGRLLRLGQLARATRPAPRRSAAPPTPPTSTSSSPGARPRPRASSSPAPSSPPRPGSSTPPPTSAATAVGAGVALGAAAAAWLLVSTGAPWPLTMVGSRDRCGVTLGDRC